MRLLGLQRALRAAVRSRRRRRRGVHPPVFFAQGCLSRQCVSTSISRNTPTCRTRRRRSSARPPTGWPACASAIRSRRGMPMDTSYLIAPAIGVALHPRRESFRSHGASRAEEIRAEVLSNVEGSAEAKVHLELPAGWTASPPEAQLHFTHAGEIQTAEFRLTAPQSRPALTPSRQWPNTRASHIAKATNRSRIADLETRHLYHPAAATLQGVDVRVAPNLKVGYIMGSGDVVPEALAQIGIKPQMLTPDDLEHANLTAFDAILVGIRASACGRITAPTTPPARLCEERRQPDRSISDAGVRPDSLRPLSVQNGRRTPKKSRRKTRKSRFSIRRIRCSTRRTNSPLADFDGWVEERGSKFMTEWDPQYKPLIECHDRDQAPQQRRPAPGALRKRNVHLHGAGALPAASGGRSRRVPAAGQSGQHGQGVILYAAVIGAASICNPPVRGSRALQATPENQYLAV